MGIEKRYAAEVYVTISHRIFFVSQHRNISQRNTSMLCIRKFPVAEKFSDRREGEVSGFPLKFFCLKVSKNAEGETFSLSLISVIEKNLMRRWGGGVGSVKTFRRKFPVFQCRKNS